MERDEFKVLVKGMKAVFTQPTFIPDQDAFNVWYSLLQDIDYTVMNMAIQSYMTTQKFPPTIADLRERCADVQLGKINDWGDGWEQVLKAIRQFGMYRTNSALDTMDELTRQTVERLGFQNICLSENINTDRANFRMIYEQLAERKQKERQTSVVLLQQIEQQRLQETSTKLIETETK